MHSASRRILLVGAGHTNLHIVRMWTQQPIPDASLTLISPFPCATYSGMLPGTLAAYYSPVEMEIDLYQLTKFAGVNLIVDEAASLDPIEKEVRFRERPPMGYDFVSIGVGSVPRQMEQLKSHPGFVAIKPMFTTLQRLDEAIRNQTVAPIRIAIVGGGAAGLEVAMCVEHRVRAARGSAHVTLVDAHSRILGGFRDRTIHLAERELRDRGIDLRCGSRVTGHQDLDLTFDNGQKLTVDIVIWVTGACPPELLRHVDLEKSESGFLKVRHTLQSIDNDAVFVVGDSAELDGESIDRAGVYAVRQGPVLWQNLNRALTGRTLVNYRPQRDFLRLLATGDGRAIGQWKWLSGIGTHWWKLKDRIDSKFMNMHRPSSSMKSRGLASTSTQSKMAEPTNSAARQMRCRGCGGKTSARVLSRVLRKLRSEWPSSPDEFLQSDDTALLPRNATNRNCSNAVSVDYFPAFLDDPWITGRIAAIHALSDLWASGVRPTAAVAMVTLPEGGVEQQTELLHHVLSGAVRELTAANAILVGGHTTNGEELSVGFTVFGDAAIVQQVAADVSASLPFSKANLRPGQKLILTKPLGTGVILAANAQHVAEARSVSAAIAMMLNSNQRACDIASAAGIAAATDITGFGLAGHLLEMCQQSGVSVELDIRKIPLIHGAAVQIQNGIRSSLYDENKAAVEDFVLRHTDANESSKTVPQMQAIYDPQTSGGLLMSIDNAVANRFVSDLVTAGYTETAIIGSVTDFSTTVRIRTIG